MKDIVWWVDKLHIQSIMYIFIQSLKNGYRIQEIRYFSKISCLGRYFLKLLYIGRKGPIVKNIEFDLSLEDSSDGEALFWHLWRDSTRFGWDTGNQAFHHDDLVSKLNTPDDKKTIQLYLKRQIVYDQKRHLGLILIAHWCKKYDYKKHQNNRLEHYVLIEEELWRDSLRKYGLGFNVSVVFSRKRKLFFWATVKLLYSLWKVFKYFCSACYLKFLFVFHKRADERPGFEKPNIGVFYAQGINLEGRSDIFWWPSSRIPAERIVIYFMDPSKPPTEELIRRLEGNGLKWFSLLPGRFNQCKSKLSQRLKYYQYYSHELFKIFLSVLQLIPFLFSSETRLKVWQFERLVWLLDRVTQFHALFKSHNIKIHFGLFSEDDQNMMALHLAMDRVDGVDTYVHWSNYPMEQIMPSHDVFFSWGPYYRQFLESAGHGIKNLLYCGYPFDDKFDSLAPKAKSYREQLTKNGVKFIISFFDNTFLPEGNWFSKQEFIHFYILLLKEIKQNSTWGLIIKPKRIKILESLLSEDLWQSIEQLKKDQRLILLDYTEMPTTAAQASDFVIGYGVFCTPSIESSLSGKRCVTFQPSSGSSHPFFEKGLGRIVFNDMNKMFEEIKSYDRHGHLVSDLGDYSFILTDIDPFRDRKAAQRIGHYMKSLWDDIVAGSTKKEAINKANAAYRKEFGENKVVDFMRADESYTFEKMY